jgi:hypothetical protein
VNVGHSQALRLLMTDALSPSFAVQMRDLATKET